MSRISWVLLATGLTIAACSGAATPPPRGVVEGDLGSWRFRRSQAVLDVEVWVPGNKAEAFTATYVRDAAEKRGRLQDDDLVSVFVTRYQRSAGVLRETVKLVRRLAQEAGYTVEEKSIGDQRVVAILGHGEAWVMWAAANHVIKVGGRGRQDVPDKVVEDYGERYPSVMPGGVLEGPLPPGPEPKRDPNAPYDADNPTPDWDRYDPDETPAPGKKRGEP